MSIKFILGRAGSGKTTTCLEQIRQELRSAPIGPPLILLTPEQASFQMEYELLTNSELKGMLRAQALSFRRLAFRVMQETGGTALVPITDTGKQMLLYKLVHRYAEELQLFRSSELQAGFIERLNSMLTEWKRYGIAAEDISVLADQLAPQSEESTGILQKKLHDLALLYRMMERELADKYVDAEDYLSMLVSGLPEAQSMKGFKLWVDGFHGLTPTEYEALGALLAHCDDVTIALTLDRHYELDEPLDELNLFYQTAETYQTILQLAEHYGIEVEAPLILDGSNGRFSGNKELSFLEQFYGKRRRYEPADNEESSVTLHAAANRRVEVEGLARELIKQVRDEGYRWRDVAILVRNLADYSDYIELIFKQYEIPVFMDQKQKTLYHPFVEFIRAALETTVHGWQYDAVFRLIKTEMLFPHDDSMPREWFDILENYVLATGINGWKWLDERTWRPMAQVSLDEEEDTAYFVSEQAKEQLAISLAARNRIVPPLEAFGKKLHSSSATVKDMCIALYELLDITGAAQRLEAWSMKEQERGNLLMARTHRQLWSNVISVLDELVELAGDELVTPALFMGMLEAGLDALSLASIPPSLDGVVVGTLERSRLANVKSVFVLGVSDGVLPMRMNEDGILSEDEREQLQEQGIRMAPSARRKLLDERFVIYQMLTKASDRLTLSYPLADEEGKGMLPSEVIRQLRYQLPHAVLKSTLVEPKLEMSMENQRQFLTHPNTAMTYLINMLRQWQSGDELPELWWDLFNWYAARPEYAAKLQSLLLSLDYSNVEQPLSIDIARELYGANMRMSVSRVERFVSCPFQHFSIYGLRLKERKQYKLDAPDMGQLFHAALGKLAGQLGASWGRLSQQKVKQHVNEIVDELIPRLQSEILLSSERFRYIARKLKEIIMQAAVILGEHAARAEFHPVGAEIDFGPKGVMPGLKLELDNGNTIEIVGRIDRVDAASTGDGLLLRVMDYKSSSKALKLEEVVEGLSLQMLTYLDVLMTHGESWLKQKVSPAGVLYFHVHNPLLQVKNGVGHDEASALMLKRYKMKGLLTADTTAVRMMDTELESGYSQIIPVALKKDESFYSSASVVSYEQWDQLSSFVRSKIKRTGDQIQEGCVSIEPYQHGDRTPCQYCEYKAVCQFDPTLEGNTYRKLSKKSEQDVWQQLGE
ncbi:helicase-exonuclease AddAB subunit AddB [Paenibacillus camelliae]|uniref:helicase-exonuclease AddAB subunit AddB n=1 Tax=Paenibacillus camelliae TaxID=512410 RepID=UPI00203B2BD9|nr:helicase-exonuclease AddAB subunit AddB [Paenibacillus camelliae]MCM3633246.1 helicase-exonuclease AddAB subunit AddB [Paenibacillus camelliae]